MRLFENPKRAVFFLSFLALSLGLLTLNIEKSSEYAAVSATASYQPRTAQSFVESIGVTTHFTYTDYRQNAYFPDVFNSVIKPKIRELGIHQVRQYPGGVDSIFASLVSHYNELSNPPSNYPKITFNFETSVDPASSSSPQHSCYLPKMKYILNGTVGNCNGLQNYTTPSSVKSASIENPNEPDHCASFICGQATPSNWFAHSLQQNPDWPDDVLNTASALQTKLASDQATSSLERLAPSFVWLPYHQNETYNGVNLKTYLEPLKNYITHGNAHPYCHLLSVATCYTQQVQPVIDYYSPKPVIITETGHSTAQYTETQQAKYLLRILFDFFERGIPRTYIYELFDEPSTATTTEQNFGLINEDGREKPAFLWLKNTLALLKDSGNVTLRNLDMEITGTGLRQTLLQKSDGSHWLALQYDKSNTTDTDATTSATIEFASTKNIEYYAPSSTVAYKTESGVTSLAMSVPDKITLIKISDPSATNNSNSSSSSSSNSNSGSTIKKSNSKTSTNSTENQSNSTASNNTDLPDKGFELKESEIQLTKNIKISKNTFTIILVLSLLLITAAISWLRLRRELFSSRKDMSTSTKNSSHWDSWQ